MIASKRMKKYFARIEEDIKNNYKYASQARKKGYDPELEVEVKLAKNLAERVVGLISVVAPQITDSSVVKRILELEQQYSSLDWRVALQIALEVAEQKHCSFENEQEAIEIGIRVGFAYVTLGVVSSPLEGFTSIEFKPRLDGKGTYFCMNFAGPIRNAGGTMAALSVIIADYVRVHKGYAEYDPTEKEILRCHAELEDYHEYITNLQYFPSTHESEYIMKHVPIEIGGDASEKYELSNAQLKDLPRIAPNKLRSGYCLIHSSCIPLKAPKLWKNISPWCKDMGMEHWSWMEEFIALQKNIRSKGKKNIENKELLPDYTYIKDLVAGRPVFGHPLRSGSFRLRYGRSRTSGYSAMSAHPATMRVANEFIAGATHIKVERPSKGAAITSCDSIDGPIVLLEDGSVRYLSTEEEAKEVKSRVKEILYLGDLLVSYGDFLDRAHQLITAGYCQEYWIGELEEAITKKYGEISLRTISQEADISEEKLNILFKKPITTDISYEAAKKISIIYDVPLHPKHTYYYSQINKQELCELITWLGSARREEGKIITPLKQHYQQKRLLELLGVPHRIASEEYVVIQPEHANTLIDTLSLDNVPSTLHEQGEETALSLVNTLAPYRVRDKAGTFIGARMGRPEKAKMRKMTGSPHMLFPVGAQGGRLRSLQSVMEKGYVNQNFCIFWCEECKEETPYRRCHTCDALTIRKSWSKEQGVTNYEPNDNTLKHSYQRHIRIQPYIDATLKRLKTRIMPDLIKGVRGTTNKEHFPEHLIKGFLRAKHDIAVNKDGTTRYDASEVTMTHFKPKEVGTSIERLRELGYEQDIDGQPLTNEDQVLELYCQDVVLPDCPDSPDEGSANILLRTSLFIDELLTYLYKTKPYYNARSPQDLIGHYIIGLAPHTSAGIIGRIIGFSKTQGFFAHPYYHAAMRRDCDGDESCFFLVLDAFLNFSRKFLSESRGSTMDAPLVLTTLLEPSEVDDMAFNVDVAKRYPLELYRAAEEYNMPWEVKIPLVSQLLGTEAQYEGFGFTHPTTNVNKGVLCSAYKTLPSMQDKLTSQMNLANKLRGVDEHDVAKLVIEKHFIRDIKGNLRKFSTQQFRCVSCNEKFRRPPLQGNCTECGGKVIFTISEGSVIKYLEPSISLAHNYEVGSYLRQTLELTKVRIESYFGKEKDRQIGLGAWFDKDEETEVV